MPQRYVLYNKEGRRAGGWRQQSLGHGQCPLTLDRDEQVTYRKLTKAQRRKTVGTQCP